MQLTREVRRAVYIKGVSCSLIFWHDLLPCQCRNLVRNTWCYFWRECKLPVLANITLLDGILKAVVRSVFGVKEFWVRARSISSVLIFWPKMYDLALAFCKLIYRNPVHTSCLEWAVWYGFTLTHSRVPLPFICVLFLLLEVVFCSHFDR